MIDSHDIGQRGMTLLLLGMLGVFLSFFISLTPPVEAQDPSDAFHGFHVGVLQKDCTDCHSLPDKPPPGDELSFSKRPSHAACQDCHADVFASRAVSGPICFTCHISKDAQLAAFPSGTFTMMASFAHAQHVDPSGRVGKASGIRQDCVFCHNPQEGALVPVVRGHPACAACHAGATSAKPVLDPKGSSDGCVNCHALEKIDRHLVERRKQNESPSAATTSPQRPGIQLMAAHIPQHPDLPSYAPYWDIHPFNHGRHIHTRAGAAIDCVTCHRSMLESKGLDTPLRLPTMAECASCHENATLVRPEYRITNCEVCHKTITSESRPLAQDGFSPSLVHSEAFRRHHADAARVADSQCRFCHTEVARADQDNCAGCHSAKRPRSHMAGRFNENTHGRLAAMDRKLCTTCHTGDFCNFCHNIPPRSHFPLAFFAQGGHRNLAALNIRSCFTCHTFENTCMECHQQQLRK